MRNLNNLLKKEKLAKPIYIFTKAQVLEDFVGIEHHKEVPMPASDVTYYKNEYFNEMLASIRQAGKMEENTLIQINDYK